jgi:hypothetical protein
MITVNNFADRWDQPLIATNLDADPTGIIEWTGVPAPTWSVGEQISFSLSPYLENTTGDPATYTAGQGLSDGSLPPWLTFNSSTGTFTGTVPDVAPSQLNFTVAAYAPGSGWGSTSVNFTVDVDGGSNVAPILVHDTASQNWVAGEAISFTLPSNTFTDPQGEALTYSYTSSYSSAISSWLNFNPETGTFSGTVPLGAPAQFTLSISAQDTSGYQVLLPDVLPITTTPNPLVGALIDPGIGGTSLLKTIVPGTPITLSYAFLNTAPTEAFTGEDNGFLPLSAAGQAIVQQALSAFASVAGVTFVQTNDQQTANIVFGTDAQTNNDYGLTAVLNPGSSSQQYHVEFANNYNTGQTVPNIFLALHELGNAVGLLDYSGLSQAYIEENTSLPVSEANFDFTVMANYFNPSHAYAPDDQLGETPQLLDVLALQYLFGANENGLTAGYTTTASGRTYAFSDSTTTECVWVGSALGGVTTFDFSGCTTAVVIDLTPGSFSSTGTAGASAGALAGTGYDNVSIAYGTKISVAIANNTGAELIADQTAGNDDVLVGGSGNDIFVAGGGQDIFIGSGGTDTAIFHDSSTSYTISSPAPGVLIVTDTAQTPTDGTTVLDGDFTSLRFADKTLAEPSSSTPVAVVSAPAALVQMNLESLQSLMASGIVTSIVVLKEVAGDFLGDGVSDFLIQNTAGVVVVGEDQDGSAAYTAVTALGSEWQFKGNGDFLGDGKEGFLIENAAGAVDVGEVSGGSVAFSQVAALGSEWSFHGAGDFLGGGQDQFLIQNTAGAVVIGEVQGGAAAYTNVVGLGPEWKFVGVGDFLGEGHDQFLVENSAGAVDVGDYASGQIHFTQVTGLGPEWKFVGTGDFLGEGHDQLLIENSAGAVDIGDYTAGAIHFTQVTALGPEWKFVGAGDYLGEGHDQFLIENSSGAVVVGDYASGAVHFTQVAALGPEWAFH